MGEPITGAWQRDNVLGYTDARKWGTGINPVHAYRGGPGRPETFRPAESQLPDQDRRTSADQAIQDTPDFIQTGAPWGYNPEDIAGLDVFSDQAFAVIGQPFYPDGWDHWSGDGPGNEEKSWNVDIVRNTPVTRASIPAYASRPWNITGMAKNVLRGIRGGPHQANYRGITTAGIPTETVSEGWLNKPATGGLEDGQIPNAVPSDPSQYEVQTSMQQRYRSMDNGRALLRSGPVGSIDYARTPIESRVVPMKIKQYSEGERHYDMDPFQMDDMPRPFAYRGAATGPTEYLQNNEQWDYTTMQRTPPPDPSMGIPDTQFTAGTDYGYVAEDVGYY